MPRTLIPDSRPTEHFGWPSTGNRLPETPEGAALVLMNAILINDPDLKRRAANQTVAHFLLDLFADCLFATMGERRTAGREALQ